MRHLNHTKSSRTLEVPNSGINNAMQVNVPVHCFTVRTGFLLKVISVQITGISKAFYCSSLLFSKHNLLQEWKPCDNSDGPRGEWKREWHQMRLMGSWWLVVENIHDAFNADIKTVTSVWWGADAPFML